MTLKTEIKIGQHAETILEKRYIKKNATGEPLEDIEGMFRRVAKAIAAAEETTTKKKKFEKLFFEQLTEGKFLPNSPTMMNAGVDEGTLSACFVIGVEDTMEGILNASRIAGLVLKYGGGTGYGLSHLRSKGTTIRSTHGKACGPVSVLNHYDSLSKMITQGGKRDGANMAVLSINHPDIQEFIHSKDEWAETGGFTGPLSDFNISIGIDDKFMHAVKNNKEHTFIEPSTGQAVGSIKAKDLFEEIVESAWKTGDPGLIFLDEINRTNPTPHLGLLESTNPCGEVPLYANEACNLASINLGTFWDVEKEEINKEELIKTAEIATRFLDNVVTVNHFPVEEITEAVAKTRKIGLGVMGWADLLVFAGIPYQSEKALELLDEVMEIISGTANKVSLELGKERGPYPAFNAEYDKPYRNATRTCMAPTGTISRIAGASSGIEPLYALAFTSKILDGSILNDVSESFLVYAMKKGFYTEDLIQRIIDNQLSGSIKGLVSEQHEEVLTTALEVSPEWHIRHQARFQKFTDLAVSKTINLPKDADKETVKNAYFQAFDSKCKGITIYRQGSRNFEVLTTKSSTESADKELENFSLIPEQIPWGAEAQRYRVPTPDGLSAHINVTKGASGNPLEVFIQVGKSGYDLQADMEAIGRLISLALRSGISIHAIHEQIVGINSGRTAYHDNRIIKSYPDGIALVLEEFLTINTTAEVIAETPVESGLLSTLLAGKTNGTMEQDKLEHQSNHAICPSCKNPLVYEEGCQKCQSTYCDFSRC